MTDTRVVTAPTVRPIFQVAVGDTELAVGQGRYDDARYDQYPTATYAGLEPEWTDTGCDVIDATTWYGRQRSIDAFDVGYCTLTVRNPTGLWDYPPVDPSTPLALRPGRMCRVGVELDDDPVAWLWTGWVDAVRPDYRPAAELDTVTVDAVDAKGQFGRVALPRVTAAVGAGESVTARMTRYADAAAFPTHRRVFDVSGVALTGTQLGGRAGELADASARSAGGDVFGDEAGQLRYAGRDWQTFGPDRPFDAVIGNRGLDGEICPLAWDVSFARSDFTTRVNYGRVGENAGQIDDAANRDRYGVETWDMTAMQTVDDATLYALAVRALHVRSFDRAPRVAAVRLDAARTGHRAVQVSASPFTPSYYSAGLVQDGRAVFARALYCTGVEHTITAGAWLTRLALDDASPWQTNPATYYDDARYDQDRYARAV